MEKEERREKIEEDGESMTNDIFYIFSYDSDGFSINCKSGMRVRFNFSLLLLS